MAMFAAVSCELYSGEESRLTPENLSYCADDLYSEYVRTPVDMFSIAGEIDDYLLLPEDERKLSPWYNIVREMEDDIYLVAGFGLVSTGGASLDTEGVEWQMSGTSHDWYSMNPYKMRIKCTGNGVWDISFSAQDESAESSLTVKDFIFTSGGYSCTVLGEGRSTDQQYSASFSIGGDSFISDSFVIITDQSLPDSMYGEFIMDVFKGDEKLDWCRITFMDSMKEYTTSRN